MSIYSQITFDYQAVETKVRLPVMGSVRTSTAGIAARASAASAALSKKMPAEISSDAGLLAVACTAAAAAAPAQTLHLFVGRLWTLLCTR